MLRSLLPTLLVFVGVAHALDITTCDQTVPSAQVGVLQADLVCPNPNTLDDCIGAGDGAPAAVRLAANATLQMNGHSITGGCFGVRSFTGGARNRIAIQGPGSISGAFYGVFFEGRLTISDVTLDANQGGVIAADPPTTKSRITATNVTANDSTGPWEGSGISAYRIDATSVTVNGNATSGIIATARLTAKGVTADGNGNGLYSHGKIRAEDVTATNSLQYGVAARRLRLRTATVTGSQSGIDLWTQSRPSTFAVTCDHSGSQSTPSIPWGVCASD